MGRGLIDLTGRRFGRLTVLERDGTYTLDSGDCNPTWHCRCDCGAECIVMGRNLRMGSTRSCGCLRREVSRERGKARTGSKNPNAGRKKYMWGEQK